MAKRTSGPAATDADLSPPERLCRTCGSVGPVAVLAQPGDGSPPLALCADCARDRRALRALIAALKAHWTSLLPPQASSDAA